MAEVNAVDVSEADLRSIDIEKPPIIGGGTYVFYDKEGVPLYVGQTSSYKRRFNQHKAGRKWWKFVDRVRVWDCASESNRLMSETVLIFRLRPKYNRLIKLRIDKDGDVSPARW